LFICFLGTYETQGLCKVPSSLDVVFVLLYFLRIIIFGKDINKIPHEDERASEQDSLLMSLYFPPDGQSESAYRIFWQFYSLDLPIASKLHPRTTILISIYSEESLQYFTC
jgi:hypothetical protein